MNQERLEWIAQVEALPQLIAAEVENATDAELDTRYREGGWTVRQVVHHLADSHMNAFIRMRLVLTEDHPTLKPYDQDAWAAIPESRNGDVAPSLMVLRGLHDRWAKMLRDVPETAWSRTAFHPEDGIVTFEGLVRTYARHGLKHLAHVRTVTRANVVTSAHGAAGLHPAAT